MKSKIECWKCDDKLDSDKRNYCADCYDKHGNSMAWRNFFFGVFLGMFILFLILGICGVFGFDYDRLNIDRDKLASDHVKEYYPEFENCTIEYNDCLDDGVTWVCNIGANIYCNELDSRDSMKSLKGSPNEIIKFEDGLDLKEIFEMKLKEFDLI